MAKHQLAPPPEERWTHIEEYLGALARRRTARRSRQAPPRTQPESPSMLLSTLPFAALIAVLAVLVVAFVIAAWPGQPVSKSPRPEREAGTAAPGWFDEAKKEMR